MADSRIEQFRKMAEADPENELGHFSLGRAYLDAGMNAEAIAPLEKVLQLNPQLSRAYHLLGTALLRLGQREEAIQKLSQGVHVADQRGDLMPRNDMIRALEQLGVAPPKVQHAAGEQAIAADRVLCRRCGRAGRKLAKAPFRNEQGQKILQSVCTDCWGEWIRMGTKVINELRLPLNEPQAQRVYEQHMLEFLNLK